MDKYIIMNKNIPLVKITMSAAGYITEVLQIYNPEAFPVGIFTDDFNKLADKLNQWWRSRIIPASRDGLRYILHLYDVESPAVLSKRSLGLSLSDQYWLKPVGSELTWQEVNFFTNDFSKELGEAFFQKESFRPAINPFTPDASSNGWLKKKWVKINGVTYLAKAGSVPLLQQPYNEIAAANVAEALTIKHVPYELIIEDNRPLCLCPNFITTETEFVPAYFVKDILPKSNNDSAYGHFLRCCEQLQISDVAVYLQQMLCLDYLIENSDRHYSNFGFIRDVNSLKFLGPAPLFDNGTSLWCESLNSEIGTALPAMPFKDTQKKQLALVKECFVDVNGIDACAEIVRNTLSTSPYLDKERVKRISEAVANRARGLKNYLSKLN